MWNEKRESMPRAELNEFQLAHLRSLVDRLENGVEFYKTAFKTAGLRAESVRSLDDLKNLPFTTKTDLRDQYPSGLMAIPAGEISRYHASSGTRGKPTLVAYSQNDLANWAELIARSLHAAGVRPGDVVHNAYGYGLFTGGLGLHGGAEELGASVVPASGGKTQIQVTLLKDLAARVLCSTPSYALKIAATLAEMNIDVNELNLQLGIFGAEPWSEPMRKRVEEELQIKAIDIYGLSEVMGPGVSIECIDARCGLHIWEDHFLPEIIDPQTLMPLPDGQEGELVFTTLQKEAMPLLRYRTGDLSILTREPCRCGRTMARMTRVRARLDDMLIIRGVNIYPSEVENLLLQIDELAPHYLLVLKRDQTLDELVVQVELTEEISSAWKDLSDVAIKMTALTARIKQVMKESLGLSVTVELLAVQTIARSEGKACRLVDLR